MTAPIAPEFLALQELLAGRYSIEREIGRGGMGIVVLARVAFFMEAGRVPSARIGWSMNRNEK